LHKEQEYNLKLLVVQSLNFQVFSVLKDVEQKFQNFQKQKLQVYLVEEDKQILEWTG